MSVELFAFAIQLLYAAFATVLAFYVFATWSSEGRLPGMPEPTFCEECGHKAVGNWSYCLECGGGDVVDHEGNPKEYRTRRFEKLDQFQNGGDA